jgi:hypothetical protein
MSKGLIVGLSLAGLFLLTVIGIGCWYVGVKNTEVTLANRYDAQFNVVETTLDTMRKTIMNQTKCTREWADKFLAVVMAQASGRSGVVAGNTGVSKNAAVAGAVASGGMGINVSRESESLGLKPELYQQLANSIEGKLEEFKRSQDTLTDIWQTHKTFCQKFPASLVVGDKIKTKPQMISSSDTKDAIKTGVLADDLMK